MTKKQRASQAILALKQLYKEATCSLQYAKPYQLLMAVRLSAQCTDARVNVVTAGLFLAYPTLEAMATAKFEDVLAHVRPCGLGNTKAKDLISMANQLLDRHGGGLPNTMEQLTQLSGIGRKSANLILGDIFNQPAVVTDTHCIRICARLGLTDGSSVPLSVERQLLKILPPKESSDFCHRLVHFGREFCTARSPKCSECPLQPICKHSKGVC